MSYMWKVIDKYFEDNTYFLTKHHLDSFNDFVTKKIPNTINVLNPIIMLKEKNDADHEINIFIGGKDGSEVSLSKPTIIENNEVKLMYPNEARLKNFSYQSDLHANIIISYITRNKITKKEEILFDEFKNVKIGSIPIMLHSCLCPLNNQSLETRKEMGECPFDQGGYFVVDGKEKVIVAQERIATNRIFINKSKDDKYSHEGLIRCTSEENPLFPKTLMFHVYKDHLSNNDAILNDDMDVYEDAEDNANTNNNDKDNDDNKLTDAPEPNKKDQTLEPLEPLKKSRNAIVLSMPNMSDILPICVIFRALGVESDKDIIRHIIESDLDIDGQLTNKKIADFFSHSIVHSLYNFNITSQKQALEYLSNFAKFKGNIEAVKYFLIHDLFPNMGPHFKKKAMFLGYVLSKLIRVCIGFDKVSNRDSYIYKRVDISGFLMGNLFRDYYNQFRNNIRNKLDREYLTGEMKTSEKLQKFVNETNFPLIFRSNIIEEGLRKSIKGMWGRSMVQEIQNPDLIKEGIVQDLSRLSYLGSISHLRRVNTPLDPTSKIVEPHHLSGTQWGIMCPCESPDGGSIGLLKNMAILCHVTFDYKSDNIIKCLNEYNDNNSDKCIKFIDVMPVHKIQHMTKILVNSKWIGVCDFPRELYIFLKLCKRNMFINIFTSVSWNILQNEINILTEAGRCCRPLFVVDATSSGTLIINTKEWKAKINNNKFTWFDLIRPSSGTTNKTNEILDDIYTSPYTFFNKKDIISDMIIRQSPIEYIDIEEANCSLVAMSENEIVPNTTYCELHPSTIFSVVTHTIPFANHNQSIRNVFSGAQGKQAIGWYACNFNNRIDTQSYMLHYPQKCLITTRYMEYLNLNKLPNGENLIVAFCTYTGYNQEDSILMNKSSVERGMFNLTYFKNIIDKEEENLKTNEKFVFMNPVEYMKDNNNNLEKIKYAKFDKIDENGYPYLNKYVGEDDVVIGKCLKKMKVNTNTTSLFDESIDKEILIDHSLVADKTVSGKIDKVFIYIDDEGNKTCKIRLRKLKIPELGDKCCSKHAQKGVIGMIIPAHDMPYTKDGLVPDIIINPHAIPSRMTIGHLLECVLSKYAVMKGTVIDGTPFCNYDISEVFDNLEKYGYNKHGDEVMYNGMTGEQLQSNIFIGPTYYERLKHMSGEKINYRSTGPITLTSRQPTQGRGNLGGLRIGEMEMNSIWAHGAMAFLKESIMERSDKFEVGLDHNNWITSKSNDIIKLNMPFSMKQFIFEMIGMSIKPEFVTDENDVGNLDENNVDDNSSNIEEELRSMK